MMFLSDLPTVETASAWLQFIESNGMTVAKIIIGMLIGMVVLLFAQRKGWLSNAQMVELGKTNVRLEAELKDVKETVDALLLELKPWRKFQEERMEAFFYENKNKQRQRQGE